MRRDAQVRDWHLIFLARQRPGPRHADRPGHPLRQAVREHLRRAREQAVALCAVRIRPQQGQTGDIGRRTPRGADVSGADVRDREVPQGAAGIPDRDEEQDRCRHLVEQAEYGWVRARRHRADDRARHLITAGSQELTASPSLHR